MLALKQRLGLFEDPFRSLDLAVEAGRICTAATRALAREAAVRSIVLLRNEGDLLPLPRKGRRLALIGPFGADRANLDGPWNFAGDRREGVDLATGIRGLLADPGALVVEPGSGIETPLAGGIARAVAAARAADIVLLAIGESANMSGEANSRVAITVPAAQQALAEALAATGKPCVVLLRHGRALALEGAVANAGAILATWFLGCETGHAVAEILFGQSEPSGRLPVSFPFATGQQPWSYDRPSTGRPPPPSLAEQGGTGRWRDAPDAARYAFGHGLAYARFDLSGIEAPRDMAGPVDFGVTITNVGIRAGTETVQLYVHPRVASRSRAARQLKAFQRVTLAPGESRCVVLRLAPKDLAYVGADGRWTTPSGAIDVWIAPSAADPGLHSIVELSHDRPATA